MTTFMKLPIDPPMASSQMLINQCQKGVSMAEMPTAVLNLRAPDELRQPLWIG